jgi:hypothetical protein
VHPEKQFGNAWILLALALALHVADEALNDFLSVWNPLATTVREQVPFLLLPTFSFGVWLTGLILGVTLLLALSPLAFRGVRWLVPFAYFLGIIMIGNGLLHIGGSFYFGRLMPGVYSSPLLLGAAIYLLVSVRRLHCRDESWR